MILTLSKKGQSFIEYVILLTIAIIVLAVMGSYIKRALQGRWKSAVDDIGQQYDPRVADAIIRHELSSNTETTIQIFDTAGGFWTQRIDKTNSMEVTTDETSIGAY